MKFHDLEKGAAVPDKQQSNEKEILSNQEFDGLVGHLNPSIDIEGSFQLTGLYVDRIYSKINHVLKELNESIETTRRIGHRVEGVRGDLMETLDNR